MPSSLAALSRPIILALEEMIRCAGCFATLAQAGDFGLAEGCSRFLCTQCLSDARLPDFIRALAEGDSATRLAFRLMALERRGKLTRAERLASARLAERGRKLDERLSRAASGISRLAASWDEGRSIDEAGGLPNLDDGSLEEQAAESIAQGFGFASLSALWDALSERVSARWLYFNFNGTRPRFDYGDEDDEEEASAAA